MCMGRIFTNRVEVAALIEGFEGYLARDRSHGTVQKYLGVLRPFGRAFPGQRIHQISAADIDSYLNEWAREFEREYGRRPKPVTVRNQVSALKAFYTYLDRFLAIPERIFGVVGLGNVTVREFLTPIPRIVNGVVVSP